MMLSLNYNLNIYERPLAGRLLFEAVFIDDRNMKGDVEP